MLNFKAATKSPRINAQNARVPPQPGHDKFKYFREKQPGENLETQLAKLSWNKKTSNPIVKNTIADRSTRVFNVIY